MDPQFFVVLRNRKGHLPILFLCPTPWGTGTDLGSVRNPFHSPKDSRRLEFFAASPNVETAAPSNTTSFRRNCPGNADSAGNPPRLGSQPGVENRKLRVVRNITTAAALPIDDSLGDIVRKAIRLAIAISTMPSRLEKVWTLRNLYIQPMTGL